MPWTTQLFRNFTGGENLNILPEFIQPNQVVSALNCVITAEGLLETRYGKTRLNTASLGTGKVLSIHRYAKENGNKYLVVQHGTSLYSVTWDGTSTIASFGTAKKTGLTADAKLRSVVWKDKLILTNGTDQAFTFDGTNCADVAAIPKCDQLYLYAGRLWCKDNATGLIENSNLEDYTNWSESGSYKVRDGEGDSVTALSPQNGGMVIFKENSAQTLYGTNKNNIQIAEPFSRDSGAVAIDSMLNQGLVMGKNNIYSFNLNEMPEVTSTHKPLFTDLTIAQKNQIFAVPDVLNKRALLYVPATTPYALCLDFNREPAITTWSGINASCFCVADSKGDTGTILFGDDTNGIIYKYDGDDDAGVSIQTRVKSQYMDAGTTRHKEWSSYIPEIEPLASDNDYRLYYSYDVDYSTYGGMMTASYNNDILRWGVDEWGTAKWGSLYRINDALFPDAARGNRISFEAVCNKRIRFNGFTTRFREVGAII